MKHLVVISDLHCGSTLAMKLDRSLPSVENKRRRETVEMAREKKI